MRHRLARQDTPAEPAGPGRRRLVLAAAAAAMARARADVPGGEIAVPVLVYHRFAEVPADAMTVRPATFDAHLDALAERGARLVTLRALVAARRPGGAPLPPRAVALSADDGHRSQATWLAPRLAREARLGPAPVTLFVYPSALSRAAWAMTWDDLRALRATGRFDLQSHTFWHPDLVRDRRAMPPAAFERHAEFQIVHARDRIAQETGARATLLAWPFGRSDAGLQDLAARLGLEAAFGLGNRPARPDDARFDLPRVLVTEAMDGRALGRLLDAAFAWRGPGAHAEGRP